MRVFLIVVAATCAEFAKAGDPSIETWEWQVGEQRIMATLWKSTTAESQPVVALCPGRGTPAAMYGQLAKSLAARGLAVFAVDIPRVGDVTYPDGSRIPPDDAFRPSFELITGPYEQVDRFFEPAVVLGMSAWRLALKRLSDQQIPELKMATMGAVGHSLGGRICGALVAADERFVAYGTMEGVPPRDIRTSGMTAVSLQMYSSALST